MIRLYTLSKVRVPCFIWFALIYFGLTIILFVRSTHWVSADWKPSEVSFNLTCSLSWEEHWVPCASIILWFRTETKLESWRSIEELLWQWNVEVGSGLWQGKFSWMPFLQMESSVTFRIFSYVYWPESVTFPTTKSEIDFVIPYTCD